MHTAHTGCIPSRAARIPPESAMWEARTPQPHRFATATCPVVRLVILSLHERSPPLAGSPDLRCLRVSHVTHVREAATVLAAVAVMALAGAERAVREWCYHGRTVDLHTNVVTGTTTRSRPSRTEGLGRSGWAVCVREALAPSGLIAGAATRCDWATIPTQAAAFSSPARSPRTARQTDAREVRVGLLGLAPLVGRVEATRVPPRREPPQCG